ncbi:MAG: 1-deoxy-D-xylulose-5-phosphate reductoisomerase [Desulfonauticus sp.]|nr:1-deoxy-D-xylulose-5-phosphate reductoisomerase [Desulfonauticus sp.]
MQYISSLDLKNTSFPRSLTILGSTGSIGRSCLNVIARHTDKFKVIALAGARNVELLTKQALQFRPRYLGVLARDDALRLKQLLPASYSPKILWGEKGYSELASLPEAEFVLSAIAGSAGLLPTFSAAKAGKCILLANKESIVLGGHILRSLLSQTRAVILPVDSEHNAIFQALGAKNRSDVKKIILTASGGPFYAKSIQELKEVTPKQALKHPNWSMGSKISIDSATLMNKGLEIIEACYLFGLDLNQVEVAIHPQSVIHSLVEFIDGSHLAQMGIADMQVAISYCLAYPYRLDLSYLTPFNIFEYSALNFYPPDEKKFPCLKLAKEAFYRGPSFCIALNVANEVAVEMFLEGKIRFLDIAEVVARVLDRHAGCKVETEKDILNLQQDVQNLTLNIVEQLK